MGNPVFGLPSGQSSGISDYSKFMDGLRKAREHRVKVFVIAMPCREEKYELAPSLASACEREGCSIIDLRRCEGIGPECFMDAHHLNSVGADRLSRELGRRLPALCKDLFSKTP